VELLVGRLNSNHSKMFTLLITVLLGIGLTFMGLDLDLGIVISTIKVDKSGNKLKKILSNLT
jgi:hypothetical protein